MPTITRGLTIALILAAVPQIATAGGLVQSLPKDGCWVKFSLELEVSGPDGVNGEHTGSWTVRSARKPLMEKNAAGSKSRSTSIRAMTASRSRGGSNIFSAKRT